MRRMALRTLHESQSVASWDSEALQVQPELIPTAEFDGTGRAGPPIIHAHFVFMWIDQTHGAQQYTGAGHSMTSACAELCGYWQFGHAPLTVVVCGNK